MTEAVRQHGFLCLDLGSSVGWAYQRADDAMPLFGTWHLADTTLHGPRYASYENELIAALERFKPTIVVMEAPLHRGSHKGNAAARLALGLVAYTEGECFRARVQLREEHSATTRKAVLGRGTFAKGTVKDEAMGWCMANGMRVSDSHQADALVLLRHTCGVQDRLRRY